MCPWLSLAILPLALAACSGSSASSPTDTVLFADPPVPAAARETGPAPAGRTLSVVLGLERDDDGLAHRVRDIATPGSPHYQRPQAVEDTAAEFGATQDAIDALLADLGERGLGARVDVTRGFVATRMTVAQAESLLGTTFVEYAIDGRGAFVAPASEPAAPAAWQGVVREVLGLSTLPSLDRAGDEEENEDDGPSRARDDGGDGGDAERPSLTVVDQPGVPGATGTPQGCPDALKRQGYKPNQLLTAYGVDALRSRGYLGQGIRMALVEYTGFAQSDVDTFTACYGIADPVTPTIVLTGDLPSPLPAGDESTLDVEVVLAVAPQLDALYVFQSSNESLADRVQLYSAALDRTNTGGEPIQVLSTSLGTCEASLTAGFVKMMEFVLSTAAAANVSVFASAGDSGSSTCSHHDGGSVTAQSASYPATSAYATAVGGTNLALDTSNAITGSSVWNDQPWNGGDGAGGGGPSVYVQAPPWQAGTGTGATMRTTPDVAFFADPLPGYTIHNSASNSGWYDDGGTSAATPLLAASTALLHQAMLAEVGASPVVAYEWIYGIANAGLGANDVFYDVVLGNNDLFDVGCCTAGPGYDQASGWGSLDVGEVSTLLNASPQYQVPR